MAYEDLNLRPASEEEPPVVRHLPVETTPGSGPKIAVAALLIVAVGVTGYYVFHRRATTAETTQSAATTAPATAPADTASPLGSAAPAIDLPPLDESDEVVRGLVNELTSNPSVAAWLATDNLIRAFTVVVSNIAAGQPAVNQVRTLRPRSGFLAEARGEGTFIDTRSYARYLPLATAAGSVAPEKLAMLYTTLKPRIDDAYRELGQADTTFDQQLERAIVVLLKTPVPQGRIAVEPHGPVLYGFADPALERLTPAQKLLIRFGPENQRSVQTSLRNIALALGIPPDRLP